MQWQELATTSHCSQVIQESFQVPVAIFKHSVRCSTSLVAKGRIEREWPVQADISTYLLDVIKNREVSNKIAQELSVRHESPQLILISKGHAVYHASHLFISVEAVSKKIKTIRFG